MASNLLRRESCAAASKQRSRDLHGHLLWSMTQDAMPADVLVLCDPGWQTRLVRVACASKAVISSVGFTPESAAGRALLERPGLLVLAVNDRLLRDSVLAARRCHEPSRWNVEVFDHTPPPPHESSSRWPVGLSESRSPRSALHWRSCRAAAHPDSLLRCRSSALGYSCCSGWPGTAE